MNGQINMNTVFALCGLLATFLGLWFTWSKNKKEAEAARRESERRLLEAKGELLVKIAVIESKIDVFWRSVSFDAARILHTPHPENARRDELLEKLEDHNMTREELIELFEVLKAILEKKESHMGERMAASLLLRSLERQYEV